MKVKSKKDIAARFARSANDSGSPEVQCAIFTDRIQYLTAHLKNNPKDFSSRRGLLEIVNKRKKALRYLENNGMKDLRQKILLELHIRK